MTPLVLIGIVLASTLVAVFDYLSKRQQRQDMLRAQHLAKYKERIRKLDNIIFGLPPNYLPKTLKVLIYASIIDSLRHLNQIRGGKNLDEQIIRVKQTLDNLLKLDSNLGDDFTLEISYPELKECKYLLKDLHTLILEFQNEGTIEQHSAAKHLEIVRHIMLEVTLDTYNEAALQALNGNNKNLALHYFSTALSRIQQSSEQETGQDRINYFASKVEQLQREVAAEYSENPATDETIPDARILAEWQALEQDQNAWKKEKY